MWTSSVLHVIKGGRISNVQWNLCLSHQASRTRSACLEDVRAEVRQLDEKFNFVQSSLLGVMAKLVEREEGTPSHGGYTCSVDAAKSNSRGHVCPFSRLASKEPTNKVVNSAGAGDLPIMASTEFPSGSQKASSGHEELAHVCNLDGIL